jgi:hypothetical protein
MYQTIINAQTRIHGIRTDIYRPETPIEIHRNMFRIRKVKTKNEKLKISAGADPHAIQTYLGGRG